MDEENISEAIPLEILNPVRDNSCFEQITETVHFRVPCHHGDGPVWRHGDRGHQDQTGLVGPEL